MKSIKGLDSGFGVQPFVFFHTSFQSTNPFPLSSSSIARAKPESLAHRKQATFCYRLCRRLSHSPHQSHIKHEKLEGIMVFIELVNQIHTFSDEYLAKLHTFSDE